MSKPSLWRRILSGGAKPIPPKVAEIQSEGTQGTDITRVVGTSYRQGALSRIAGRKADEQVAMECRAQIALEPSNPHDPEALLVTINETKVGYLSHEDALRWRPVIKRAFWSGVHITCEAKIVARGPEDERQTENAGVILWLPEPDELAEGVAEALRQLGR